jgi:hypothetical protein
VERRDFINKGIALSLLPVPSALNQKSEITDDVFIERSLAGQPHKGKVLAGHITEKWLVIRDPVN